MRCSACATNNPGQAKFCMGCGAALLARCASCQADLPAAARFCINCGQPAGAPSDSEEAGLQRLNAAVPAPLAAKMRAASLAGERKIVTALFADVVGSTALAEQMDAEDWTAMMNGGFDAMSPAIYRYEGTIARLLGDALLAFFGAPVAHEDDPARALHAALELLEAVRGYAERARRKYGVDFAVRVGLNTGPVVVGNVGSDLKFEYTAMGDAVNMAARMQSAARPMTVLISEHTQRFVAPYFELLDLGPIDIKGKAEPVRVYEVLGAKLEPGRARGLTGLESPMVGRAVELARLLALAEGVRQGRGGLAAIVGEAGLGKSRLVAEWRAACLSHQRPLRWVEGRCLSYDQGLALHLLIDLLRGLLGAPPTAGEPELRAALLGLTGELFAEGQAEVYPYLAQLLSLELEGEALERVRLLDPQALQLQHLAALRRLLLALAARQPLALVCDDIHWADPSSVELLGKLLPLAEQAPIIFCCISRPDQSASGWRLVALAQASQGLAELWLQPLSESDSKLLVANLLEIEAIPEHIRSLILQKAEGNPFFVEEVIRMLIDRGAIVKHGTRWAAGKDLSTIEIPDNLQGLLLARIDQLPEEVKRTLRVASVIGRQFSLKVLEQVLERAGER